MTDAIHAGCRISRVRPKHGGATIAMLPTRPAPDDSNFVPTLVWVLDQARRGRVLGYAVAFITEDDHGTQRTIEAARQFEGIDGHHVLGAIRRMEAKYMQRTWPEDE